MGNGALIWTILPNVRAVKGLDGGTLEIAKTGLLNYAVNATDGGKILMTTNNETDGPYREAQDLTDEDLFDPEIAFWPEIKQALITNTKDNV